MFLGELVLADQSRSRKRIAGNEAPDFRGGEVVGESTVKKVS